MSPLTKDIWRLQIDFWIFVCRKDSEDVVCASGVAMSASFKATFFFYPTVFYLQRHTHKTTRINNVMTQALKNTMPYSSRLKSSSCWPYMGNHAVNPQMVVGFPGNMSGFLTPEGLSPSNR